MHGPGKSCDISYSRHHIPQEDKNTMGKKNFRVELLPDEPVLLFEIYKEYTLVENWPQGDAETRQFLDQASQPLYHIIDTTQASFSLDDIILGANKWARGQEPLWKHPNLQELIFVTTNATVRLAAKGLNSLTFGNIQAKVFETQEEALDYCRAKIAKG
jgi:predicted NBD/HSP70 family sugar kinase